MIEIGLSKQQALDTDLKRRQKILLKMWEKTF